MNVDVDARGGFRLRGGLKPYYTVAPPRAIDSLIDYRKRDGTSVLVCGALSGLYKFNGTTWDTIHDTTNSTGKVQGAVFNNKVYFAHVLYGHVKEWDGTTLTALSTPGFADDFGSPTTNRFPNCLWMAVHHNVMFAANIQSESKFSRVRWSHPGTALAWRTDDWIDIDPDDGNTGGVRAIVPFGERLLVFKRKAVYAIDGFPPEGFTVTPLTKQAGAEYPEAVAVTENAVYWWDENIGAMMFDGKSIRNIFEPLSSIFLDGSINLPFSNNTTVGYFNRRVFFSVPMSLPVSGYSWLTYIYDTVTSSWVRHGLNPSSWLPYRDSNYNQHLLGAAGGTVYEYEVYGQGKDIVLDGAGGTFDDPIVANYQTRWFDDGNIAMRKRWKRPEFAILAGQTTTWPVEVYKDYDASTSSKTFFVETTAGAPEGVWDTSDWDEAAWARRLGDRALIERGSPLGSAVAVSLNFRNPPEGDWGVFNLVMKYVPRKVRN